MCDVIQFSLKKYPYITRLFIPANSVLWHFHEIHLYLLAILTKTTQFPYENATSIFYPYNFLNISVWYFLDSATFCFLDENVSSHQTMKFQLQLFCLRHINKVFCDLYLCMTSYHTHALAEVFQFLNTHEPYHVACADYHHYDVPSVWSDYWCYIVYISKYIVLFSVPKSFPWLRQPSKSLTIMSHVLSTLVSAIFCLHGFLVVFYMSDLLNPSFIGSKWISIGRFGAAVLELSCHVKYIHVSPIIDCLCFKHGVTLNPHHSIVQFKHIMNNTKQCQKIIMNTLTICISSIFTNDSSLCTRSVWYVDPICAIILTVYFA